MYVGKRLSGVEAIKTLSRLNHTTNNIGEVFVLDFAIETEDIQDSFQFYYQQTILSESTVPNKLYDLKRLLEEFHLFTTNEVEIFARA